MILHLMLNSVLVFIWMALAIEILLYCMKISNARVRYLCRALPFLKIPFDLVVFLFFADTIFINLNPFSCEIYTYELIASWLSLNSIPEYNSHLIIPQYIAAQLSPFWISFLTIAVLTIALAGIVRKLWLLYLSRKHLKAILSQSTPYDQNHLINKTLKQHLQNVNAAILISNAVEIPCATGNRYILLPTNTLQTLSGEELEAVIAHELQHLKWRDPICKFLCTLVSTLCWWIPTYHWMQAFEAEQEMASDAGIDCYAIDKCALASAIKKILQNSRIVEHDTMALCFLGSGPHIHLNRLKSILSVYKTESRIRHAVVLCLAMLIFGSVWMC